MLGRTLRYAFIAVLLVLCPPVSCQAAAPHSTSADDAVTAIESQSSVGAAGRALTSPYPRLSIWYPNPWRQPLDKIARYGYVIFYRGDGQFVPRVKALNPDLIALTKANASLIGYDPDQGPETLINQELSQISTRWLLTQVGGRLSRSVSATDTVLPLDRVRITSEEVTYKLFVPGDSVVIDDEIAYVRAVDTAADTLVVQRGRVKPAASHEAGARVAATISSWPGMLVVDASTFCPIVTTDASVGPQTWASFKAREVARLLTDPVWDGVMIDTCDGNKSWLIGATNARTIDPERSNTLVNDYRTFDAAWNTGMRGLQDGIRELVGGDEVLIANNSVPNFATLNGNNFEAFPNDAGDWHGTAPWDQLVLGPNGGSYFEWMASAQKPNFTTITTYQHDGGPKAASASDTEPTQALLAAANYRKMRFGLCTSLLNDGFFSYEESTDGQAALGLYWFDEYDNSGEGGGYLGQPLGPPSRLAAQLTMGNSVVGSGFDIADDLAQWRPLVSTGYSASVRLDTADRVLGDASARIDIGVTSGHDSGIQLLQRPLAVADGADYTLSYWAKADRIRTVSVAVQKNDAPWDTWLNFGQSELSTTWRHYVISATARGSDPSAGLYLKFGQTAGTVWLDDVRVQPGSLAAWRRDFQGGVVLVNASSSDLTTSLGGIYRKIKGSQVPAVNDGSLVSRVKVPAKDGLILLRPTTSRMATATIAAAQLKAEWRRCTQRASNARTHYARVTQQMADAARVHALKARDAWRKAWLAARAVRARATAWRRLLDSGDVAAARRIANAARPAAFRARGLMARAWSQGHGAGSGATTALVSARRGCEKVLVAQDALVLLP